MLKETVKMAKIFQGNEAGRIFIFDDGKVQ